MTVPAPDPTPSATLAGWREITEAATPGPWEAHSHQRQYSIWHDELDQPLAREVRDWDDAVFISAVRTMMPRLVAALEAVLALTEPDGEVHRDLDGNEEHGVVRVVRCDMLREAITTALTGTPQPGAEPAIKPVGWCFTDSDGAERVKTRWQFNAFVARDDARASAVRLGRGGQTWYIWRLDDGSYDHTAVPDPMTPGHPAELVETITIEGYGRRKKAVVNPPAPPAGTGEAP